MDLMDKPQAINELYTCIQGEGRDTGKPMILIRMSGCRLRCQFSETSFCDTPYSSWNPEKGKYSLNDVIDLISKNPQIKHLLISGGGPTLNPSLLIRLVEIGKTWGKYVCIETEGSEFVETKADFISLSPKLASSAPRVGTVAPDGKEVTEKDFQKHEEWRSKKSSMKKLITCHPDYQFKPVICCEKDLLEVIALIKWLDIPSNKVWVMPEGQTDEELSTRRKWLADIAIKEGWNYTDRLHVVIWGKQRGV